MSLTGKIMTFFEDKAKTKAAFPRTKVKAVSDDSGRGLDAILDEMGNATIPAERLADNAKSKGVAVTLAKGSWSSNAQTVSVTGVTASNNVIVSAAPASREAYNDAEIYCSAQAAGTLTFKCGSVPAADVTVNVVILI